MYDIVFTRPGILAKKVICKAKYISCGVRLLDSLTYSIDQQWYQFNILEVKFRWQSL